MGLAREEVAQEGPTNARGDAFPVVVVVASAGGLAALSDLLSRLPVTLEAAIVVVQHLHPDHPSRLAEILGRRCALPVSQATDASRLEAGRVLVASPARHLVLEPDGGVSLTSTPLVRFVRPSADVTLESAARVYGARAVAVILTGTGADGTNGSLRIHEAGGTVLVQSPREAAFPSMPLGAIQHGWVDRQDTVAELASVIATMEGSA